jgi:Dipeptidyl peptidase IV (DPP IV) N-terminal region
MLFASLLSLRDLPSCLDVFALKFCYLVSNFLNFSFPFHPRLSGKKDFILNGKPDWLYANTPELNGDTVAFSTNGSYLSFFTFNITNVQKYE